MQDHECIIQRALDYIEGWYQADATRMERTLSPTLVKRRVVSDEEIWEVNQTWMVDATRDGRGRIDNPEKGRKDVTILDQTATIASVKVVSEQFIDYLHLAKTNDTWRIVNVLWDYVSQEE